MDFSVSEAVKIGLKNYLGGEDHIFRGLEKKGIPYTRHAGISLPYGFDADLISYDSPQGYHMWCVTWSEQTDVDAFFFRHLYFDRQPSAEDVAAAISLMAEQQKNQRLT